MTKLRNQTHLLANLLQKKKINTLLAGLGSARIVKTVTSDLKNAALTASGFGQHFQDLGHRFSLHGPPSRPMTYI